MEEYKEDPAAKWSQSGGKGPATEAATHIKNCLNARDSVLYSERHNWIENKEANEPRGKKQGIILHLTSRKRLK